MSIVIVKNGHNVVDKMLDDDRYWLIEWLMMASQWQDTDNYEDGERWLNMDNT